MKPSGSVFIIQVGRDPWRTVATRADAQGYAKLYKTLARRLGKRVTIVRRPRMQRTGGAR